MKHNMLSNFITYIQRQELFRLFRDRILLAVSGGIDSIALVKLCQKAGVKFGIAHCNFQLRGEASDGDALFVQQIAQELDVSFYSISFDTKKEADSKKKSIQMAARDLRYEWLEKIRSTNNYQYIAVAHHHNDSIETLLINLTMGCGIRGLHGILPKNGFIIRPLLFSTRADIETYINQHQIFYREDSSNTNTKYTRNALRHLVVPQLQRINPNLEQTFEENFLRFRETEALYQYAIKQLKKEVCIKKNEMLWINIQKVTESPSPMSLLFELLSPFQFKTAKIHYLYKRRNKEPGAIYNSKTHQLLRDRKHWIVRPIARNKNIKHKITALSSKQGSINTADLTIHWEYLSSSTPLVPNNQTAYLDADKLTFPLYLRHWEDGDILYPLGMKGKKKKLSKFFKDIKMNRFEKDATWLLCDRAQNIIWVMGHRADERFKVDNSSLRVLKLSF